MIRQEFDENAVIELSRFCKIERRHEEAQKAHPAEEGAQVAQS